MTMKTFIKILTVSALLSAVAFAQFAPSNPPPPSQAILAWNPVIGATGYKLYQGSVSRVYPNVVRTSSTQATTPMNAAYGGTNFFAVSATNAAGLESVLSAEATYVSDSIPNAPSGVPSVIGVK